MLSKKSMIFSRCLIVFFLLISVLISSSVNASAAKPKVVRIGDLFANTYTSLDPHKSFFGWYTSTLGLSETLFRIDDSYAVVPWLAESASVNGTTWTIKLRDNVKFSDGSKLTADMAVRCIERACKVNERSRMLDGASFAVVDEKTFTISTPKLLPTVLNELCNVYMAMVNLDASKDIKECSCLYRTIQSR